MIIAGLTGGIATGKSTVATILKNAGAVIIDADKIAHKVVSKGFSAWEDIVKHFGKEILLSNGEFKGEIDRKKLGDIIFNDSSQKQILNKIVHPYVFNSIDSEIKKCKEKTPDKVVILDIPLLLESGVYSKIYDVIVVYIPLDLQIKRLIKRDHITRVDALARINSQMPIEEKKQLADIVIDNSYDLKEVEKSTRGVYAELFMRV